MMKTKIEVLLKMTKRSKLGPLLQKHRHGIMGLGMSVKEAVEEMSWVEGKICKWLSNREVWVGERP